MTTDSSVSMHHKKLQKLVVENYKVMNRLSHEVMNEVFRLHMQNHYSLRISSAFQISTFNTIFKGKENTSYLGLKIWKQVPEEIKYL